MNKPKVNSESQKELDRAEKQFEAFDAQVKEMTLDRMNTAPDKEREPQTKLSSGEVKRMDAPYIKPVRSISSREQFNEKYRADHTRAWEYIKCIVENNEIIGEDVECWTKKFAGDPAHFWKIPVNKPVYIPRLLAKQISDCKYHRLRMEDTQMSGADHAGTYVGTMVVDQVKHRLDCREAGNSFASVGF
jgi:hypothetical protein